MKPTRYFIAVVSLLATFSQVSIADEEKEKSDATVRERSERNEEGSVERRKQEERAKLAAQFKQQSAEMERRARELASQGRQEEANAILEQLRNLKERVFGAGDAGSKFQEILLNLKLEEQELLEKYGPDHPKVRTIKNRLDLVRKQLVEEHAARQEHEAIVRSTEREGNDSQRRVHHLRQAAENLAAAGLREQAEQIRKQAEDLAVSGERGFAVQSGELRELQQQVRQLAERLERVEELLRRFAEQQEQNQKLFKNQEREKLSP